MKSDGEVVKVKGEKLEGKGVGRVYTCTKFSNNKKETLKRIKSYYARELLKQKVSLVYERNIQGLVGKLCILEWPLRNPCP